jgi:hypothetical protein
MDETARKIIQRRMDLLGYLSKLIDLERDYINRITATQRLDSFPLHDDLERQEEIVLWQLNAITGLHRTR